MSDAGADLQADRGLEVDRPKVVRQDDLAIEFTARYLDPLVFLPGLRRGHGVGEDQMLDSAPLSCLCGLGDGRVVIDDVFQPLERKCIDDVITDSGLDVHIGTIAQSVYPGTRDRVTSDHDDLSFGFNAIAHRRMNRSMIGRRAADRYVTLLPNDRQLAVCRRFGRRDLGDLDRWLPREILMMIQPVTDVVAQHRQGGVGESLRPDGAGDAERVWSDRQRPTRRHEIVEVGYVVRMKVGEEGVMQERWRGYANCSESHEDAAAAIEEQVLAVGLHQ